MLKYTTALLVGALIVASMSSCDIMGKKGEATEEKKKEEVKYRRVVINDHYSMEIPQNMKATDQLEETASLQYYNITDDKYIMAFDESRDESYDALEFFIEYVEGYDETKSVLENIAVLYLEDLKQEVDIFNVSDWERMEINGMEALRVTYSGEMVVGSGSRQLTQTFAYNLCFVESETTIYTICSWTKEDKKADFYDEQIHMFKSLKEMDEETGEPVS